jgi:hypothetical protein
MQAAARAVMVWTDMIRTLMVAGALTMGSRMAGATKRAKAAAMTLLSMGKTTIPTVPL